MLVLSDTNAVVVSSNRLQEAGVPALEPGMVVGQLALADALIIGNCNNQVGRLSTACVPSPQRSHRLCPQNLLSHVETNFQQH